MGDAFPDLGGAVVHLSELSQSKAGKISRLAQALHASNLLARWPPYGWAGGSGIRLSVPGHISGKCFVYDLGRRNLDTYRFGGGPLARETTRIRKGLGNNLPIDRLELGQNDHLDRDRILVRLESAL